MPNGGVQVETPRQDIAFDGERIIIFGDEEFRNVTCGMCGDFDGEKVADFRSPRDFPLSSATLLYASYSYNSKSDSEQCEIEPAARKQIRQEESIGGQDRHRSFQTRSYRRSFNNQNQQQLRRRPNVVDSSSSSSESNESQQSQESRRQQQPKRHQPIRQQDGQICVSQETIKACPYGYKGEGGVSRPVKFLCFHKSSSQAKQVKEQIKRSGEVDLTQQRWRDAGERQIISVHQNPDQCRRQQNKY